MTSGDLEMSFIFDTTVPLIVHVCFAISSFGFLPFT